MFKNWKKITDEFKNSEEHMALFPLNTNDPEENLKELIKLSERTNSCFRIFGDYKCFTIKTRALNILNFIMFIIVYVVTTIVIFGVLNKPLNLIIEMIWLALFFLYFRYSMSSYDIEINSYSKNISIKSNNFIGKFIIPEVILNFKDFEGLKSMPISKSSKAGNLHFNRLYIVVNKKKLVLIDLPNGPYYFINHNIFIESINRIVKSFL